MKNKLSILFLFGCLASTVVSAQSAKGGITASDSVIKQDKFDKSLWSGWSKVETDWNAAVFYPSLKTYAVKMNCKNCESVTMTVQLKVDATGHLSASKVIKENKCGAKFPPKMKSQWLNYFGGKYEFPPAFRGKVVEVTLGTSLKC